MEGFLGGVNWSFPTWDMFILLFFVISVILYGIVLGRNRILVILFSIYISLAITSNLPYINDTISEKFGFGPVSVMKIAVFSASIIILYVLFSKMGFLSSFSEKASLFHIAIFSFLHVGLLISTILSFLPPTALLSLSDFTRTLFTDDLARFIWIIAPLAAMFMIKPEETEDD